MTPWGQITKNVKTRKKITKYWGKFKVNN
jgi:hypothetical protein